MGVRNASAATTTIINASLPSGADTIVCTTGLIGLVQDNAQILIHLFIALTMGSTATGLILKLRRGATATGTAINAQPTITTVATNIVQVALCYADTPGIVGQMQYTLTAQPAGGGTNTVVADVCLMAAVL
jgi:hypothetical protein